MAEQVQHTLYQVSTATALVEGIYKGAVQVATLREHGNMGLGTFEGLDGEMVVVDAHFFQVRSDGSVREAPDNVLIPFAAVTAFSPDKSVTLENCPDLSFLTSRFDTLRQTDNFFYAESRWDIRVHPRPSDEADERRAPAAPGGSRSTRIRI